MGIDFLRKLYDKMPGPPPFRRAAYAYAWDGKVLIGPLVRFRDRGSRHIYDFVVVNAAEVEAIGKAALSALEKSYDVDQANFDERNTDTQILFKALRMRSWKQIYSKTKFVDFTMALDRKRIEVGANRRVRHWLEGIEGKERIVSLDAREIGTAILAAADDYEH